MKQDWGNRFMSLVWIRGLVGVYVYRQKAVLRQDTYHAEIRVWSILIPTEKDLINWARIFFATNLHNYFQLVMIRLQLVFSNWSLRKFAIPQIRRFLTEKWIPPSYSLLWRHLSADFDNTWQKHSTGRSQFGAT